MLKNLIRMLIVLAAVSACSSGKDAVQDAINKIPPPDITPPPAGNGDLSSQAIADDVPLIADTASYYGKHAITLEESLVYSLAENHKERVVDLEFTATADTTLFVGQLAHAVSGCDSSNWNYNMVWIEVESDGNPLFEEPVNPFDPLYAAEGSRYIFRTTFTDVENCFVSMNIKFTTEF